jgi:hypothetical protein
VLLLFDGVHAVRDAGFMVLFLLRVIFHYENNNVPASTKVACGFMVLRFENQLLPHH